MGYLHSRMPEYTEEEKALAQGAADFFGVNHYTAALVYAGNDDPIENPTLYTDSGTATTVDPEWATSASVWLNVSNLFIYLKNKQQIK